MPLNWCRSSTRNLPRAPAAGPPPQCPRCRRSQPGRSRSTQRGRRRDGRQTACSRPPTRPSCRPGRAAAWLAGTRWRCHPRTRTSADWRIPRRCSRGAVPRYRTGHSHGPPHRERSRPGARSRPHNAGHPSGARGSHPAGSAGTPSVLVEALAGPEIEGFMRHGGRRAEVGLAPLLVHRHAAGDLVQLVETVGPEELVKVEIAVVALCGTGVGARKNSSAPLARVIGSPVRSRSSTSRTKPRM